MNNDKELFKVKDLRLAAIKYYSEEANGIELTDPIGYVILEELREDFYANPFDVLDFTPVYERLPYANTTKDGMDYGSKLRHVINEEKSGPCYVLTRMKFTDYFDSDLITRKDLEEYILNSSYYFRDRKEIAMKNLKKHPVKMFKVLYEDAKSEEKFSKFFEKRDFIVLKK